MNLRASVANSFSPSLSVLLFLFDDLLWFKVRDKLDRDFGSGWWNSFGVCFKHQIIVRRTARRRNIECGRSKVRHTDQVTRFRLIKFFARLFIGLKITSGKDPIRIHLADLSILEKGLNGLLKLRVLRNLQDVVSLSFRHVTVPKQFTISLIPFQIGVGGELKASRCGIELLNKVPSSRMSNPGLSRIAMQFAILVSPREKDVDRLSGRSLKFRLLVNGFAHFRTQS